MNNSFECRNLILGAVRGYSFEQLKPFVRSLKKTGYRGDLVFLWNTLTSDTLHSLEDEGVKLAHFEYRGSGALNSWSRFWPQIAPFLRLLPGCWPSRKILKTISPLMTVRIFAFHDFILENQNKYSNILLTDVRDVLFQADPFLGFDGGLKVYEEDNAIRLQDEKVFNAMWVRAVFGRATLDQIGHFPIICAGTTMGDIQSILNYLVEFEKLLPRARNIVSGTDQAIHNYLCRLIINESITVIKNGDGPVLTMGPTLKQDVHFKIDVIGDILNSSEKLMSVLHQFDRHPEVALNLLKKHGA